MAVHLSAKAPGAIYRYTWTPDVQAGDGLASYSVSVTSGTAVIDSDEMVGDSVVMFLSGGAAGETTIINAEGESNEGEYFEETIYLPIVSSASQIADTARSYVNFALRKLTGIGVAADSVELDDALERLNAIVATWRAGGADIGAPFPIEANSIIYCPDWAVSALRYNLLLDCASLYGAEPTAFDVNAAQRGLQLVKHMSLKTERSGADFY